MEEFKKGEHTSWDPDEEIQMWKRWQAMLDGGGDESEEDEELAAMIRSPKQSELGDGSKEAKPEAGVGNVSGDVGKQGPIEHVVSQEDITKD